MWVSDALIDDIHADLRKAVNVGFTSSEVSAFYSVIKEAINAVAIIMIILGGVDATLGGDGVSASRTILITEALNVVAEFAQASSCSSPGEAGADNDDVVLAFVGRIN